MEYAKPETPSMGVASIPLQMGNNRNRNARRRYPNKKQHFRAFSDDMKTNTSVLSNAESLQLSKKKRRNKKKKKKKYNKDVPIILSSYFHFKEAFDARDKGKEGDYPKVFSLTLETSYFSFEKGHFLNYSSIWRFFLCFFSLPFLTRERKG